MTYKEQATFLRSDLIKASDTVAERDATIKQLQEENQRLKSTLNTICLAWKRGDGYEFYEDLIEKHNLAKFEPKE